VTKENEMPHASFATTTRGLDLSRPPSAIGVKGDAFCSCEVIPFGLVEDDFSSYAMTQCSKRFERLKVARVVFLEEVPASTQEVVDRDDGCKDQDRII
jgi:hypothetical protein